MFPIHVLHILKEADDNPLHANNAAGHPPIFGLQGQYFGHEWARWRHDSLDQRVDDLMGERRASSLAVLDIGCASGVRAAAFARAGHRVTALDVIDRSREIAAINAAPARVGPDITFVRADIRLLDAASFGEPFDLVHARRVVNFLAPDDLDRFFAMAAGVLNPGGLCAVSFVATGLSPDGALDAAAPAGSSRSLELCPGMFAHSFGDVHGVAARHGLSIREGFSDARVEAGFIASAA